MSKKILLHVGTHKTGSSALQKFLFDNHKQLLEYGIDYLPSSCIWNAHHGLGWSFQGNASALRQYCPWHTEGIINQLERTIEESSVANFILSSENLYQLKNLEFIERFFSRFSEFEFYVLIYLRNQADFIESWYYELVRADYCKLDKSVNEFVVNPMYDLNYNSMLTQWARFVKRRNITIVDYSRANKSGRLLTDFCARLNLSAADFRFPKRINERVTLDQLDRLLKINRKGLAHNSWLNERDIILSSFESNNVTGQEQSKLINDHMRLSIEKTYQTENNLLYKNFGFKFSSDL